MASGGGLGLLRLQSECRQGLRSSEGLSGARRSAFRIMHSHGHWQEASVPWDMGLSMGCLSVLMMWGYFPLVGEPREGARRIPQFLL